MQSTHGVIELRVCAALALDRSSVRHQSIKADQTPLIRRIRGLARTQMRYGCFRHYILLRREGGRVNQKRVHRL